MSGSRHETRRHALVAALTREGIDALLVTSLPNLRYLTGFTGSAGLLLVREAGTALVTDFRYAAQAPQEAPGIDIVIDPANVWERLGKVLQQHPIETLGVEAASLTIRDAERVSGLTRARVVPTTELVERLRMVKAPEEADAIRQAAALAQEALAEVLPTVRVGQTELEIASRLEAALRRRGSEWHPFQTIVASGPRAALPHARSSPRAVQAGELLLLDFGAMVDGYSADLTRTVVVGAPADSRQRLVYELVQEAQRRARENVRAGMSGREADALARDVIAERGFGESFGHSLGHGLGLEVHEAPRLSPTNELALPEGAVVTVEPGIYLPGWGGVRLEDDVHLSPAGPELLSDGRTALVELT